ncbi:MAG: translation initiation factor IF-2 [Acidobacteriota bacterium]
MQNIKLHEATKQFNISNKLAMFFLEKNGIPVKSHSSAISMEQLELLRDFSQNLDKFENIVKEFKNLGKGKKKKEEKAVEEVKKEEITEVEKPKEIIKEKEVVVEEKVVKPEIKKPEEQVIKKAEIKPEEKKEVVKKPEVKKVDIETPVEKKATVTKAKPVVKKQFPKYNRPRRHSQFHHRNSKKDASERVKKEVSTIERKEADLTNVPELIQTSDFITLKELGDKLNIKLKFIEDKMRSRGKEFLPNQFLDEDGIKEICKEFNVEVDIVGFEESIFSDYINKNKSELSPRSPIVTVMGHVDHGKTTLLDTLRKTKVVDGEAGGITQSIGAYRLKTKKGEVIFIDTPGHEAFTNLRARGARVTDIVILVVAANDGIKPQTIEAIDHARAANVPIIVAINKIDLDSADPNKVKQELTTHNLVVEDWGGDVVSVDISAKLNQNLDSLLEMVNLVSEMQELKAYSGVPGWGTIIESHLDPKLGPIGTVLIQEGDVKRGDYFICGNSTGKIRSIFDDTGKTLNIAERPWPVKIMGFEVVPEAGERLQIVDNIVKAKKVIELRKHHKKENKRDEIEADKKLSLQNLFQKLDEKKIKEFPIILKTDNFGSGEILEEILMKMGHKDLKINLIHKSIGNISDSDILLASTSGAIILGFNVKAPQKILVAAKREKVEIKLYNVIYHLMEELDKAIKGEIEPVFIETLIGKIEVLQKFKISKLGIIAGCIVKEGKVTNKSKLKVLRNDDLVFEGEIETLKRIKDEVKEVKAGTECGIKVKNFNSIEIGDVLEAYELKQQE